MVLDATTDNFEDLVVKSQVLTLVDFWGPKCIRCLELMPFVENLEQKNAGKLQLVKVDASKNRRLCLNLRILGLPAFLFYQGGKEIKRFTGNDVTKKQLQEAIDQLICG